MGADRELRGGQERLSDGWQARKDPDVGVHGGGCPWKDSSGGAVDLSGVQRHSRAGLTLASRILVELSLSPCCWPSGRPEVDSRPHGWRSRERFEAPPSLQE